VGHTDGRIALLQNAPYGGGTITGLLEKSTCLRQVRMQGPLYFDTKDVVSRAAAHAIVRRMKYAKAATSVCSLADS